MDRPASLAVLVAIPFLAVVFYLSTRMMNPFWGYALGLAVYWFIVLMPLILWRSGFQTARFALRKPAPVFVLLNLLLIAGVAVAAVFGLYQNMLPLYVLIAVALGALLNGTLEEVFWRGVVLKDNATQKEQIGQIALFTSWHIALLFASGIVVTGGALALLAGAAFAGTLWTFGRMQTGTIGFGILCHVGLNLFAFTELATKNFV